MTNEAKNEFIEKAGTSVEITLPAELTQAGVKTHHEAEHMRNLHNESRDFNVHPAGDAVPVSTQPQGVVDHRQFEINRKKPISDAARWLAERLNLNKQKE